MVYKASKRCFKCGEIKILSHFYVHAKMSDGYLNKCKECTKTDTKVNRKANVEFYREYDRKRGNRKTLEDLQSYRKRNIVKYRAHTAVNNAVRDGRLVKKPCEMCNTIEKVHAHHDDYTKSLDVRWLCPIHHFEWHSINGEGKTE